MSTQKLFIWLISGVAIMAVVWVVWLFNYHRLISGALQMQRFEAFEGKPADDYEFLYIAHAGGGYQGKTYTNSREAIEASYRAGVTFIEVDIVTTTDQVDVLAHNPLNITANEFLADSAGYHHLTVAQLLDWMTDKSVFIITDVKAGNNIRHLSQISAARPDLLKWIIPQAYTIDQISPIHELGFERIIYTNYESRLPNVILKRLARTRSLFAIALPFDFNFKQLRSQLKEFETPVLAHTINDGILTDEFRRDGLRGIYTDFLLLPSLPH